MRGFVWGLLSFSILMVSSSSAQTELDPIDFFLDYEPIGTDLTEEVIQRSYHVHDPSGLEDLDIIFIPGLFSDWASGKPRTKFDKYLNLKPQFYEQIKILDEWNLAYEILDIESQAGPSYNARLFADWLSAKEEASIALITHSKGGVDALQTFIEYPELRSKIKFWIPLQAPFLGTPIADMALSNQNWKKPMDQIFKYLGGSIDSVISVSVAFREPYMDSMYNDIIEIGEEIPILSVAASKPDDKGVWDTRFEPFFRDWMWKRGIENDGIIPWKSSVYPYSYFVHIEGIDHLWIEGKELQERSSANQLMKSIFITALRISDSES